MKAQKRPKFTRQHYKAIAEVIKESVTRSEIIDNLSIMFVLDNWNFDEVKFRIASQME